MLNNVGYICVLKLVLKTLNMCTFIYILYVYIYIYIYIYTPVFKKVVAFEIHT